MKRTHALCTIITLVISAVVAMAAPPNVVMIISDDQGWGDYSFMGHAQIRTPHLDKLAAQSLVFPRGYVPSSLCCPSLASIVTGLYPHQHKVTSNDPPIPAGMKPGQFQKSPAFQEGREVMNKHMDAAPSLPRLLAQKDYLSLQTGKWWQGHFSRGGFTHGMTRGARHGDEGLDIGRKTMQPIYDFIETATKDKKPFFIWYAPMMPHQPHNPPERLLAHYKDTAPTLEIAKYWGMVEWFDETCGQLLDHLDQKGLAENTIVLYVTDNGWIQKPNANAYDERSKQSPYDGGLRTPIMIRWPGKVAPRNSEQLAMSIDFAPTLLAALGLKPTAGMQGINLLDEDAAKRRKTIFGECFTHNAVDVRKPASSLRWRWVIDGDWKLIAPAPQNEPDGKVELFNLARDPHEEANLADKETPRVERLKKLLDAWWPGAL